MSSLLEKHVRDNFAGMLVIGDLHADYESFMRARNYSESHNLFFMSLGDLVDRGSFPFETVQGMYDCMLEGKGGFTIGNHDDKYRRFYHGSKVVFSADGKATLAEVGPERQEDFLKMYSNVLEMANLSAMYHQFDDIILVHASCHPCMFEGKGDFPEDARTRALYGISTKEIGPDGYAIRLYTWINEIPKGKTVIVGHDKKPFNSKTLITCPLVKLNDKDGKAIFLDTGCGKGGFLSGVIILYEEKFKIDRFVEFK